jgi:hypothetical protein
LPFCYFCAKVFLPGDATDMDHVPPESCFAKDDRNVPLVLRTHVDCNHTHNSNDELVGQLVSLKHGRPPTARGKRLNVEIIPSQQSGDFFAGFDNLALGAVIRRWVRGFHAALYREPLEESDMFYVSTPVPAAEVADGVVKPQPIRQQHLVFVETIKINRAAQNLDRIECNNQKLQYECVWAQGDNDGPWLCIFALNLYEWKDLGDPKHFPPRGCVGCYLLPSGKPPAEATLATRLRVAIPNFDRLDPFGR